MDVLPIRAFTDNYIWAIIDWQQKVFDCVDPGEAIPVLEFSKSQQLQLRTILLTHHHFDHVGGVSELKNAFPTCTVYGPEDRRINGITTHVEALQTISVGQCQFQILFNPGHTATHISYYEATRGWLFCGDTLFSAGCGRVFDGTMEQLHQSLKLFKTLPPDTKIFCAHEYTQQNLRFAQEVEPNNTKITHYLKELITQNTECSLPSTLELELAINPFLRTEDPAVKEYALLHGAHSSDSLEVFTMLRNQKNMFK